MTQWSPFSIKCDFSIDLTATDLPPKGISTSIDENHHHATTADLLPATVVEAFQRDGFVVLPSILTTETVMALNERLDHVLRGDYDRGNPPDKAPALGVSLFENSSSGAAAKRLKSKTATIKNGQSITSTPSTQFTPVKKVLQVINVHKSDVLFQRLVCHPLLGRIVAQLAGWESRGTRLAQDQIWAKPPGAGPLSFHRDSPYFMFKPNTVLTVWVALDDMDATVGPLEYVVGSHRWDSTGKDESTTSSSTTTETPMPGNKVRGTAPQFFPSSGGGKKLLEDAARLAGVVDTTSLRIISMAGLPAGSITIHNGNTWHGSGRNQSMTQPRRGLGIHYVPAQVRFTSQAIHSRLWRPYVTNRNAQSKAATGSSRDDTDIDTMDVPDEDFPIVWEPW